MQIIIKTIDCEKLLLEVEHTITIAYLKEITHKKLEFILQ
jgi:hypothetical protein